jgi:predicted nucleotidyltransferase component of viral defense system
VLSRAELQRLAYREKVALGVLEKDYVLTEILNHLYLVNDFKDLMVFKGGTALRKIYYPDWRYSEDLDFTVKRDMPIGDLKQYLNSWHRYIEESTSIRLITDTLHKPNGYARIRLQFTGPLDYSGRVFMDLTFDEPLCLEPASTLLITNPFSLESHPVPVYPLEEILAEKMRSLIERGKSRDYYDVWRILEQHRSEINIKLLADVFSKKLRHKNITVKSINDFFPDDINLIKGYWEQELGHQLKDLPPLEEVLQQLRIQLQVII